MPKKQKIKKVGNEALYQAMMDLRFSSAAQRHTPKPRKGTRTAQKSRAIKEFC